MEVGQMQRQWVDYTKSLFLELQQLQDESNPDFVVQVWCLFSLKILRSFLMISPELYFKRVDAHVHQFKGSSSSRCT
ncbi:hypothetical protein ACFX2I_004858 [Malus domestica]